MPAASAAPVLLHTLHTQTCTQLKIAMYKVLACSSARAAALASNGCAAAGLGLLCLLRQSPGQRHCTLSVMAALHMGQDALRPCLQMCPFVSCWSKRHACDSTRMLGLWESRGRRHGRGYHVWHCLSSEYAELLRKACKTATIGSCTKVLGAEPHVWRCLSHLRMQVL